MSALPVHAMFDIETLGTADNAPIVQIGAVLFSPWGKPSDFGAAKMADMPDGGGVISAPGSEFRVSIPMNDERLKRADWDTIQWWMKQSDQARQRVMLYPSGDYAKMHEALDQFTEWARSWGGWPRYWWSSVDFDVRLLRAAYLESGRPCPFGRHGIRDYKTLRWIGEGAGIQQPPFVGVKHDALDDAMHQAYYTIKVLRALGAGKEA